MRWLRQFFGWLKVPEKRAAKARRRPPGAFHRVLCCEPLEDRRLLSVSLPTGKGDWTFYLSDAESNLGKSSAQALFDYEASQGVKWVAVKAQDGTTTGDWGYSASVVAAAHNAGLKIYAYAYVYGNYYSSTGEAAELSTTLSIISSTSPDGFIIDAETEYQGQASAAAAYSGGIKAAYPNLFLAYAPFPIISDHESYPYLQFGEYCDAVMPQAYFETGSGYTPAGMVAELDSQWSYWQDQWEDGYASSIKPIIPICQAYNDSYFTDNGSDLLDFVNDLKNDATPATAGGYQGVSFFDADAETPGMRTEIADASIGIAAPVLVSPGSGTSPGPTVSGTSQTFKWDQVTSATSYLLQVQDATTGAGTTTYPVSGGSTTSYALSGLTTGDAYLWNMYACDGSYMSSLSTTDYFTIQPKPATPAGLSASATGLQSISLTWSTVSGATSYTLDRSTSSSGGYAQVYSGSTAHYADSGLQFGTTYYYEVAAGNGSGSSAFSSPASATTLSGVPADLTAAATGSQSASVRWNTVSGVTGYTLDRSTSSSGGYVQVYSGASAQYADGELQPDTTYYYEVRSYAGTGGSAFSSPASATTSVLATWTGGGSDNTWSDAANWGGALPGSADTGLFSAASYARQPSLSSAASLGGIWDTGAGAITIGGTSALTLIGTTINGNTGAGIEMDAGAGPLNVNSPLVLQDDQQWINNSASVLTVNGPLSGAGSLTKLGSGTVTLSGTNSYSGGTVVAAGKLIVLTSTGLADGSSLMVGAGALQMFGATVAGAAPTN
jgi:autotransporter-associated beta strand protein